MFQPEKINISEIRKLRNDQNIKNTADFLKKAEINYKETDPINYNAFREVLRIFQKEKDYLIQKCKNDQEFALLLAINTKKLSTRQGSFDEDLVREKINKIAQYYNFETTKYIDKTDLVPITQGTYAGKLIPRNNLKTLNIQNNQILKSIDLIIKKNNSHFFYAQLKVCMGNGGHQDNVFHEMIEYIKWAIEYGENDKIYAVIIETDNKKINLLHELAKQKENIWIVDHYSFQIKFIKWHENKYNGTL